MAWRPTRKGPFEVKSYYRVLSDAGIQSFTWRSIWKVKVPHRVFSPPSLGQQPKVRFWNWIIWGRGIFALLTAIVWVRIVGNRWITCFFTVLMHSARGTSILACLVSLGWCLSMWGSCWLVGGEGLVNIGRQLFGRQFCFVLCGLFGRMKSSNYWGGGAYHYCAETVPFAFLVWLDDCYEWSAYFFPVGFPRSVFIYIIFDFP